MARRGKGISFKMVGGKELEAALHALPGELQRPTLEAALMKVAGPIGQAAQAAAEASKDTGKNQQKIIVSPKLSRRQRQQAGPEPRSWTTVYIGVRPSPVAHLIEFGTGPRWTTGGGDARRRRAKRTLRMGHRPAYRGIMPPSPFMRPAWDGGKMRALDELGVILGQEIEAAARRVRGM